MSETRENSPDLTEALAWGAGMREALEEVAEEPGCGCKPICQCRTPESMVIELEEKKEIAKAALAAPNPAALERLIRERVAEELTAWATGPRARKINAVHAFEIGAKAEQQGWIRELTERAAELRAGKDGHATD